MPAVSHTLTRGLVIGLLALGACQRAPVPTAPAQPTTAAHPAGQTAQPEEPVSSAPPLKAPPPESYVFPSSTKLRPKPPTPVRSLVWDMGLLSPGAKKEHKFALTNDSEAAWTVKFVTPDCKCAVGEFSTRTLKPKETSHLAVSFRADQREGDVLGAIAVDFQELEAPRYFLYLKGEVRRPLSVLPNTVDFGKVGPGDQVSRSVEVRNYTEQDISPPNVQAPPWLRVELKPVEKKTEDNRARQTWQLELHADPAKLTSAADPGVLVVTGDTAGAPVTVPLSLRRKAALEPNPGEVVFENFKRGETSERTFLLETYPNLAALTEQDLVLSHTLGDELTVVAKKLAANRFQLVVRYQPRAAYASVEGELTVGARRQDIPPARVKIRGTGG